MESEKSEGSVLKLSHCYVFNEFLSGNNYRSNVRIDSGKEGTYRQQGLLEWCGGAFLSAIVISYPTIDLSNVYISLHIVSGWESETGWFRDPLYRTGKTLPRV